MYKEDRARRIKTKEWYCHTRVWGIENYFDAKATIIPDQAKASEFSSWEITVQLGEEKISRGDHIAIEVNVAWRLDRGRPWVVGRKLFGEEWNPGFWATPKFVFPENVEYEFAITPQEELKMRFHIIDVLITSGEIPSHSSFKVYLADPEGSLIQCPWFAQKVPVPIAIQKKADINYRRLRKIPVVYVEGAYPDHWKINLSLKSDHKTALIKIIAADNKNENPVKDIPEPNILNTDSTKILHLSKHDGYQGAPIWKGEVMLNSDFGVVEALNRKEGIYGKSNPVDKSFYMEEGKQVYFGDLHGQTISSAGLGTMREYFDWAKNASLLDFTAPANHYGGRKIFSNKLWQDTLSLCEEFNHPNDFVTLFSYEWGLADGPNHRNVYYEEKPGKLFDAHSSEYNKIHKLWEILEKQGLKALTIPHHTKFISRINWEEFNPKYQRLVEVCSCWGNSEQYGIHSVQKALKMGHRLGVVGGTDTHFAQPGTSSFYPFGFGGLTGVICEQLDRKSVWQAMHERNCYATTGARILLDFRINNHLMGSEIEYTGKREITGKVFGTAGLKKIEIIRNNKILKTIDLSDQQKSIFAFTDREEFERLALTPSVPFEEKFIFYYLRVRQKDGHWAMSSPIWFISSK